MRDANDIKYPGPCNLRARGPAQKQRLLHVCWTGTVTRHLRRLDSPPANLNGLRCRYPAGGTACGRYRRVEW